MATAAADFFDTPSPLYLFFDTETSDLPVRYDVPVSDLQNWPRIVQFAWMLSDSEGNPLQSRVELVQPVDFEIAPGAAKIHGITRERAMAEGKSIDVVLKAFLQCLPGATLVAHNLDFDEKIVGAEFLRAGHSNPLPGLPKVCTMRASTSYCAIPGKRGFKWPKLEELHTRLFSASVAGAHDAAADVAACARCFFELRRLQVL